MTEGEEMRDRIDGLRRQLRDVHRIRGRDLRQALRRSKRLLPRYVRTAGARLAEAEPMLGHPKLERMLDFTALRAARKTVEEHLNSVDKADLRRGRLLGIAGAMAFNLLIVIALFLVWVRWVGSS
jgi:hypothetical protein